MLRNMENKYLVFLLLSIISCAVSGAVFEADTLLSVVQVFRHGERTPIVFYPTDPYENPSFWDGLGTGQLTENGKKQLTELGKYFRDRYDGFVSTDYSEEEIYMWTVSGLRNLLSAESFLKGLYDDDDTTDIPIYNTSVAVMSRLADCLRYDLEWANLELTDEYFKKVNETYAEDFKYIRENSKFPVYEFLAANSIWDTLHIEKRVNLILPEWTDKVFPEALTNISNEYALSICYNQELQTLAAGPFIHELIRHFETVLSGGTTQKIQLYSAHDVNIACLLSTFEAFNKPHMPDFASSLIFELRQGAKGNYINTYYKPSDEAIPINLRGCAFDCKFEDFKTVFKSVVLSELGWYAKCFTPL